ncbi:hypothetical protein BN946_scf185043.g150 [Trametes cinnabarina]|uniref:Chromatin target of PRMT1 protein C-terminal domain-containing protein n=1 Tax=Pycnoporus cinnabarinus TaxID=5643 RepID=A0A060SI60_PYCCI|nr:hypothetical protein BN946_scf185043.g150 [Trametes cinnabarina]
MDTSEVLDPSSSTAALSYDDTIPYEDQVAAAPDAPELSEPGRSLAERIGNTKVYLLSDASKSRGGKRKHEDSDEEREGDVDMDDVEPSPIRDNAILLRGTPISHLPTSNIFAYAKNFDTNPLGLEWVDDTTCVLVFETKSAARAAFRVLQKSVAEEPSLEDGSVTAKPIPITIWPAEDRISATLGKGDGLKGILRMRWARVDDVKKKGAKAESQFYKKYGENAGKTFEDGPRPMKRRRGGDEESEELERARLDAELDHFLADDEEPRPRSPPSKMRSDHIQPRRGKTLLERTEGGLASRITAPLPRRARTRREGERDHRPWDKGKEEEGYQERYEPRSRRERGSRERTGGRRPPRPKVTREDLDAELDAFLDDKL